MNTGLVIVLGTSKRIRHVAAPSEVFVKSHDGGVGVGLDPDME